VNAGAKFYKNPTYRTMKTLSLSNFTLDEFLKTDREVEGAEGMRSVHGGKYLPFSLLARDMQAGVASQGGALRSARRATFASEMRCSRPTGFLSRSRLPSC
jgi:hypothetical protein